MEDIEKQENNEREFLIYPSKFSSRILAFLADFFICFIASVFLFELAILPLSKVASGYSEKNDNYVQVINQRYDYLYENNLMSYNTESTKYIFREAFKETATNYIKYFVFDKDENLAKYDIFSNYYIVMKEKNKEYLATTIFKYQTNTNFSDFFNTNTETFDINLKNEYVELFKPYYDSLDKISKDGEDKMNKLISNFIEGNYYSMFNDLDATNDKFKEFNVEIGKYQQYLNQCYIYGSIITCVLVIIIFYFIIPLFNEKGRTIGKIILKIEPIKVDGFFNIELKEKLILGGMSLVENLSFVMFIPVISAGFAGIFALTPLFYIFLIGFIYDIVALIFAFVNKFKQSPKELISRTVIVSSELMDELFIERGKLK